MPPIGMSHRAVRTPTRRCASPSSAWATGARTSFATSRSSRAPSSSRSATGDPETLAKVARRYPGVRATTEFDDVLASADIDAVVIATPVSTHHPLAAAALAAGKHVFVEKPLSRVVGGGARSRRTALASAGPDR